MRYLLIFLWVTLILAACSGKKDSGDKIVQDSAFAGKGSFAYDVAFLQQYKNVIVLGEASSPAKVLIIKDYQGRVMTSTAQGDQGDSFGWINYKLISSSAAQKHFNPVGGEERIWLGPEGGQYSIFFKKGDAFDFEHWETPAIIDTDTFDLVTVSSTKAVFKKSGVLTNYHGFTFHFDIRRQIDLVRDTTIERAFGISTKSLSAVGYVSSNSLKNTGTERWEKKSGLLSIWLLGMFTPSEKSTIIIPHEKSSPKEKKITDNYFGEIPADRLIKADDVLMLKADGRFRGKVGLSPEIATNKAGSYNAEKHVLTLIKFNLEKDGYYVNSKWETQKEPFKGDAVNAYNDGPLADGGQLGPFYELESSSAVRELKPDEMMEHRQMTVHLQGDEDLLNEIAVKTLGVSLSEITNAFKTDK